MTRFLGDALRQAIAPEWRLLGLLGVVLLTATNMVIMTEASDPGRIANPAFIVAALVRMFGLFILMIALMRSAVSSPRAMVMPDGAFWASVLLGFVGLALVIGLGQLLPLPPNVWVRVAINILAAILLLPLAAWTVALATVRPLAINPRPWVKGLSQWLPPLIFSYLILILPIALLHGHIDFGLMRGTLERSWWLEIFDGALSCAILLIGIGLKVTAYRRVANR